jgi:hypothetical protein
MLRSTGIPVSRATLSFLSSSHWGDDSSLALSFVQLPFPRLIAGHLHSTSAGPHMFA